MMGQIAHIAQATLREEQLEQAARARLAAPATAPARRGTSRFRRARHRLVLDGAS
jgi:hypothetical protein